MNITETIVKMVQQVVPSIENEIKAVESRLVETKSAYNRGIAELIDVEGKAAEVRSWLTREVTEIEAAKTEIQQARLELSQETSTAQEQVVNASGTVEALKHEFLSLSKKIEELKSERDSIGDIVLIKTGLLEEVSRLNEDATKKSKVVSELTKEIENLTESKSKAESNYLEVNKDIILKIETETKELREYANQLSERSKALDSKEDDLKTVEARWKKLYESKGSGFKI